MMITNTRKPIPRRRKGKPRRGRVICPAFMAFARTVGCILRWRHACEGPLTFHHVREFGSPKDDTKGFCLCAAGHLLGWNSKTSIEAGKRNFERHWQVSISQEVDNLRNAFEELQG